MASVTDASDVQSEKADSEMVFTLDGRLMLLSPERANASLFIQMTFDGIYTDASEVQPSNAL